MTNSPTSPSSSTLKVITPTPPINMRRNTTCAGPGAQPSSPASMGASTNLSDAEIDKQLWRPDDPIHQIRIFSALGRDMQPSAKGQTLMDIYEDLRSLHSRPTVAAQGDGQVWSPDVETFKSGGFEAVALTWEKRSSVEGQTGSDLSGKANSTFASNLTVAEIIKQGEKKTQNYRSPSSAPVEGFRYYSK